MKNTKQSAARKYYSEGRPIWWIARTLMTSEYQVVRWLGLS